MIFYRIFTLLFCCFRYDIATRNPDFSEIVRHTILILMRFLIKIGIFMFYFHKKHPKSHIEKIYYFPIAIIPICKVSTIELVMSMVLP